MFKAKEKFVKKRRRYKRKLHATRYTLHEWEGECGKRYTLGKEGSVGNATT